MYSLIFLFQILFSYGNLVQFTAQGPITDSQGKPIDVGTYAAPLMVDWDGDGLEDLLAGQFEDGRIRFYPNTGTAGEPVFSDFQYLRDGGGILSVPYG